MVLKAIYIGFFSSKMQQSETFLRLRFFKSFDYLLVRYTQHASANIFYASDIIMTSYDEKLHNVRQIVTYESCFFQHSQASRCTFLAMQYCCYVTKHNVTQTLLRQKGTPKQGIIEPIITFCMTTKGIEVWPNFSC